MKGWGSVYLVLVLGVFMGAGCGGRTGALSDDGYGYEPNDQAGNGSGNNGSGNNGSGGAVGTAGRSGRAGAGNTGGAGPIPTGGVSFGGSYVTAGAYSGGAYPGGYGFGGTTGIAGGFMMGGFGGIPSNDCQSCIFETCGDTLSQCLQDFGCISILACTQATGCEAFQCYDARTCGPVIDQWGGPGGPSMSMLLDTFSCVVTSGCPCN